MNTSTAATHFSTTRKSQRLLTKYLKLMLCLNATSKGVKTAQGWESTVKGVSISKPVKSVCKSLTGRNVQVLTLCSKG